MIPGFASSPPQLPEWCPPSRRSTESSIGWPPRAPRKIVGRSGADARPVRGDQHISLQELVLVTLAKLAQPGGADLLTHLDQDLDVEAQA
jgi:hypothetical protein